jgi:hypothetical protein
MITVDLRLRIKPTVASFVLAFVTGPYAALSQPVVSPAAPEGPLAIVEQIEKVQSQHGIQAPELIDPLTALAHWYQESGDHDLAIAAIEQARHVVTVNLGLHSIEEALLLRQLVQIDEAGGDVEAAWKAEKEVLGLVKRHPNDLRRVPVLREIARKRMDVLTRYRTGEFPPQIVLGCYYSEPLPNHTRSGCNAGNQWTVIAAISSEVEEYLTEANRTFGQPYFSSCTKPHRPEFMDQSRVYERHERATKRARAGYLSALSEYIGCVQAEDRGTDR